MRGKLAVSVEVADLERRVWVVRRSKDVARFPLTEKTPLRWFFDSPPSFQSGGASPAYAEGTRASSLLLRRRNTLPLGESQICASRFGEGETGDKVGVEMFPAGLRESQHWGGATLRTNGVASSPHRRGCGLASLPCRLPLKGGVFRAFNSRFGFVPRKGRVFPLGENDGSETLDPCVPSMPSGLVEVVASPAPTKTAGADLTPPRWGSNGLGVPCASASRPPAGLAAYLEQIL